MSVFTTKVRKYTQRLMDDLDTTRIQACGIWGNLGTETGGFTALQEKNPVVRGSRGGYGWMQWTGPRRRSYEAWCAKNSLDPAADESNYRYLVYETKTAEKASLVALRKCDTVEEAVETFMQKNLRPGVPHLDNRKKWGRIADAATKDMEPSEEPETEPEAPVDPEVKDEAKEIAKDAAREHAPGLIAAFFSKSWFLLKRGWLKLLAGASMMSGEDWLIVAGVVLTLGILGWYAYRYWKKKHDAKLAG